MSASSSPPTSGRSRLLTDPITYFFAFWLPSYLKAERGFALAMIGAIGYVPVFCTLAFCHITAFVVLLMAGSAGKESK